MLLKNKTTRLRRIWHAVLYRNRKRRRGRGGEEPTPGPTLSFLASFYDGDNKFILQVLGTGTPTTPHIAAFWAKGADGFHHEFGADKHVISGGRYVDEDTVYATDSGDNLLDPLPGTVAQPAGINLIPESDDTSEWGVVGSVLTQNKTDLKGNAKRR